MRFQFYVPWPVIGLVGMVLVLGGSVALTHWAKQVSDTWAGLSLVAVLAGVSLALMAARESGKEEEAKERPQR